MLVLFVALNAKSETAAAQEAKPTIHALLVGCGNYPLIKPLNGPTNDVAMTAETLSSEPYSIPKSNLRILSSAAEGQERPTKANILREFESLSTRVERGDHVFILLAGHGTRVINDNPQEDWEPDGHDEVFLPIDASFKSAAEFGLRDDTIGDLLDRLRDRGVSVFLVVDCCFSGTMSRSPFADAREVAIRCAGDPTEGSSIIENSVLDFERNSRTSRSTNAKDVSFTVLYACPPSEKAIEQQFDGANWHGRLTWRLNQVLRSTSIPLTYRELEQRVQWEFTKERWVPIPWLSGSALDRVVLGVTEYPDRSRIMLSTSRDGRYTINAGLLHNMSEESVLELSPLVGDASKNDSKQLVRVTECHPLFSYVEKLPKDSGPLNAPARCTLVEHGIPKHYLKIAFLSKGQTGRDAANKKQKNLGGVIGEIVERNKSLLSQTNIDEADLILVQQESEYSLETPESILSSSRTSGAIGPFKVSDSPDETQKTLECQFTAAARASLLRRLATLEEESIKNEGFKARMKLQHLKSKGVEWTDMSSTGETLFDGDSDRIQITNTDRRPFDVNMLYIDSEFGIESFFPSRKQVSTNRWRTRLEPGQKTAFVEFEIGEKSVGLEDLVVLLTSSTGGDGGHFLAFEQPGLRHCSGSQKSPERIMRANSKAGALLQELLFSSSVRQSIPIADLRELTIRRLTWHVQDRKTTDKK